ncbi:hypothetical protein [Pectobacterium polaris]|uniref:hypothetical protein n=1 Tax=Pectobacterium polaris TaxID=2042057 RepID=UPI000BB335AC|nr:hypothetical protein [Pectobacterium polaris]ASY76833.1 hypothetical protein BJJ97_13365 [Pectobacterium polaris]
MKEFLIYIDNISHKKIEEKVLQENILKINNLLDGFTVRNKYKLLTSCIIDLIESIRKRDFKESYGLARFIFLCNFDGQIGLVRKLGAFRTSKYGYNKNLLTNIIFDIYQRRDFTDEDNRYITSVISLSLLSSDILSLKNRIQSFVKSRPNFLKNALAIAEVKFRDIDNLNEDNKRNFRDDLYYLSRETVVSSISYTLQLLKEVKTDVANKDSIYVEECSMDEAYLKIFYDAYLIQLFNDAEINVDFFCYDADLVKDNGVVIHNKDFEYSLRQGYAKSDLRWQSILLKLLNDPSFRKEDSFSYFMEDFCENGFAEEHLYSIVQKPIERIVLVMSIFVDNMDLFSKDHLFFEERAMLWTLSLENYNVDFINKKLYKDFNALDIIKIQRFFGYLSYVYNYAYNNLVNNKDKDADIIRKRSVLPVIKTNVLADTFSKICGHSTEDCLDFISRISIDFSDEDQIVDLQYSPIVKMGDSSLILPTIFSCSNLIRAFALNENVHLSSFDDKDSMVNSIKNSFQKAGFYVKSDFKYGKDEIDILAFLDDSLFIFECKNPYHPVNSFELRNTYGHILKGFDQINKFKGILSSEASLKQLLSNAGIDFNKVNNIHYGIINANRALYGMTKDNVKVYHANELMNFIETGEVNVMGHVYKMWESNTFTQNDLVRFLKGDVVTSDFKEVTLNFHNDYQLRSYSMIFLTHAFEVKDLPKTYNSKYKLIN